ncbi:MAG: FAD-dependent monooxygenase [Deltaproteobacteria bacterium]|nr:FAD-dependent monooxygenase [Deltaproteobacteria bacterium]
MKRLPLTIGIVGAGPAGLYFALLMKKSNPAHRITIVEQNPAHLTYGWGVVFSGRALSFLRSMDVDSYGEIEGQMQKWDDQTIIHKNEAVRIDGSVYSGIARIALLNILQRHCRRVGVEIRFEERINDLDLFSGYHLIVGADGVNSTVRAQLAEFFQPRISFLSNKYIWYGTHQLFDTLSLIFREYRNGCYVGHCYRYSDSLSTFIVECDEATWERAGFARMGEQESKAYCEEIFRADLKGHSLLSNKAAWLNFKAVVNQNWRYDNVVLLGDALRTVHFSIGSGTRMALEDAIAVYRAFEEHPEVDEALKAFEERHRPNVDRLLSIARRSYDWYENFHCKMGMDAMGLAYDYMMRSGRIDFAALKQRAPRFSASYEAWAQRTGQDKRV